MSAPDLDANPSPEPSRTQRPRQPKRQTGGGKPMHILLGVAITVLLATTAFAVAVLTGLVNFGPQSTPVESSPAIAQPQGDPQPGAQGTAPAPQSGTPQAPQTEVVKRETFGDWIYTCVKQPGGDDVRCAISQHLSDAESRRVIFLWRVLQDGEGGLVGVWQTPQAVLLHPGIRLAAGAEEPIVIPYETCRRGRCQATVNLSDNFVELLRQAENLVATIVMRGGQPLNLTISVSGLTDALNALRGPNPTASQAPPQ